MTEQTEQKLKRTPVAFGDLRGWIDALRKEINDMKNIYEDRINDLQNKLSEMEKNESLKVKSLNCIFLPIMMKL